MIPGSRPSGEPAGSDPITVLVAESESLERGGLVRLLEAPGLLPTGSAGTADVVRVAVLQIRPQVLVIDLDARADLHGWLAEAVGGIPCTPAVVGLARTKSDASLMVALECGVRGYLQRAFATGSQLQEAVRAVAAGRTWIQPEMLGDAVHALVVTRTGAAGLTGREVQLVGLLARGCRNNEIAAALFVSEKTIRNCLTRLFSKLGVHNRTEAVSAARRLNLV